MAAARPCVAHCRSACGRPKSQSGFSGHGWQWRVPGHGAQAALAVEQFSPVAPGGANATPERQQGQQMLRLRAVHGHRSSRGQQCLHLALGLQPLPRFDEAPGAAQAQPRGVEIKVARLAVRHGFVGQRRPLKVLAVHQHVDQEVDVGARGVLRPVVFKRQGQAAAAMGPGLGHVGGWQPGLACAGCSVAGRRLRRPPRRWLVRVAAHCLGRRRRRR